MKLHITPSPSITPFALVARARSQGTLPGGCGSCRYKWARLQLRPQKLYSLHIRGAVCRLQRAWGVPPQTPLRFSFSLQI